MEGGIAAGSQDPMETWEWQLAPYLLKVASGDVRPRSKVLPLNKTKDVVFGGFGVGLYPDARGITPEFAICEGNVLGLVGAN